MPFVKINAKEELEQELKANPHLIPHVETLNEEYDFIQSLVKARKERGLTQKEVAHRSGLTQQMVSRIETTGNSPTLGNLIKYTQAIGVRLTINPK